MPSRNRPDTHPNSRQHPFLRSGWLGTILTLCTFGLPPAAHASATNSTFIVDGLSLPGGPVTFNVVAYPGVVLPPDAVVLLDGKPLTTVSSSYWYIRVTGYIPLWKTGTTNVAIAATATSYPFDHLDVPINPTGATFDQAARFSTQAAFGPRPDVVMAIQQAGLSNWITSQLALPGVAYDPTQNSRPQFLRAATSGNSLLRLRVAYALQTFLVSQCTFLDYSCIPWEQTLERDATANFRQLLTDVASDASIGQFLNMAGSVAPTDPTQHPNQNFARELMQLFTLGPDLLWEDGSLRLDSSGNPIPTYTQDQVVDLSRVFTGWKFGTLAYAQYTALGVDYLQPLESNENFHDHGFKVVVGPVGIAPSQTVHQDRDLALDAIFAHPNLPPHVSRLLIQHLVKSAPSPAFVYRITQVFKDNGAGIRGDLAAVVRAILLDPEARWGDNSLMPTDGFLQDPLLFQIFATSINELTAGDNQTSFIGASMGQNWWFSPSVFGFYHPDYIIPGTTINSPEFQIFNNLSAITRSEYLWNLLNGTVGGYQPNSNSWLLTTFQTVPDLVEALNHLAFHGQMPTSQQAAIIAYCATLPPTDLAAQFRSAIFLALNSDNFIVSH